MRRKKKNNEQSSIFLILDNEKIILENFEKFCSFICLFQKIFVPLQPTYSQSLLLKITNS